MVSMILGVAVVHAAQAEGTDNNTTDKAFNDCQYAWGTSSAAQSCDLQYADYEAGSHAYCFITANCTTASGYGQEYNSGRWLLQDVPKLINNNGNLELR
ncbi:hypothetical protein [Aeromonas sobria]|nr:hypothetical protein [Aeromonas sobria]